jgi:23S rRNA pseudouridine955/2504/2580 synthase|tara:strand:+ start:588 stop:1538 length:951 start_codon:yes stop_codon:yes gene_type:complete
MVKGVSFMIVLPDICEFYMGITVYKIKPENEGQRLDNFLLARLKGTPKSHIYGMIRRGSIRVNRKRTKPKYTLQLDDQVSLPFNHQESAAPDLSSLNVTKQIKDSILIDHSDFVALNKPSGVASQPGTNIDYALGDYLHSIFGERFHPVHRLDRGTSGVILFAKHASGARQLQAALNASSCEKVYQTVVGGTWTQNNRIFEFYIDKQGKKMAVCNDGVATRTAIDCLSRKEGFSFLKVQIWQGKMHQIRVTLSHLGHPILADSLYGDVNTSHWQSRWPFLHAGKLGFEYKGKKFEVSAPMNKEQLECLNHLFPSKD